MENMDKVIIHAARLGELPVLQELIDRGTNVNAKDEKDIRHL